MLLRSWLNVNDVITSVVILYNFFFTHFRTMSDDEEYDTGDVSSSSLSLSMVLLEDKDRLVESLTHFCHMP